jgi:coenzyme F420-0:L-glutamate ligase/coenzyme F420-1:gamma-L-glutamate ligase
MPLVKEGDNLSEIIIESLKDNNIELEHGDIIVIAQTIVSKSLGMVRDLNKVKPSRRAHEIYKQMSPKTKKFNISMKSPELIQLILDESKEIIKIEHVLIVETNHGFVCANAGIDKSNVEGDFNVTLLPQDADRDAEKIRNRIKRHTGKNIAVIISDSFGRPFRIGAVGVGLGVSGINPILDKRGAKDLFGYKLQSTIIGQIDNLASSAQLLMGETNEGLPVVIIRGYKYETVEKTTIKSILREKSIDLFREEYQHDNTSKILKSRRSYKLDFSDKRVERKIIEDCIDIARWAPSAHNGQYWRYIIIEQGRIRENLINMMNIKLKEDLTQDGKSADHIKKKVKKTKNQFLNAPYLILLCLDNEDLENYSDIERTQNEFIMGIQSISASATYFLLALESRNIAACWYCAPLFAQELIKETLHLPISYTPMAFFAIGYPLKIPDTPKRKKLNEIIFELQNEK